MAVDEESGDATFTTVVVDVLSEGQAGESMVVKSLLMTCEGAADQNKSFCVSSGCCSPLQCAGRRTLDELHGGQGVFPQHGDHDGPRMHHVFGNVVEEKAQRQEGPAGERLRGSRKTSQCGEVLDLKSSLHVLKAVAES